MLRSLARSERGGDPLAEKEQQILWEKEHPFADLSQHRSMATITDRSPLPSLALPEDTWPCNNTALPSRRWEMQKKLSGRVFAFVSYGEGELRA